MNKLFRCMVCWLGIHSWEYFPRLRELGMRVCRRCKRREEKKYVLPGWAGTSWEKMK